MLKKIICIIVYLGCLVPAMAQADTLRSALDSSLRRIDTTKPPFIITGKPVTGLATIYDLDREGAKTASGEMLLNIRLTAGTNYFKLNSWVQVTNPKNGKSVILRINDRLSKKQEKKGAVVSLTTEAARSLGINSKNNFKIKMESIAPVDSLSSVFTWTDSIRKPDTLTPNTFRPKGKALNGIASFYSYNLDGTLTSTGERYRNNKLTAASNNFKLNTWVLVTNLRNKRSVIVRINDRMHPRMKAMGRVVDLSRDAAKQLDFIDNGLTKVKVQPIEFIFSKEVKRSLDSVKAAKDSLITSDSVRTELPAPENNFKLGIASFYSPGFDGLKTATGEIFRNNRISAASNDFKLNTWVRVTNLSNSKSIVLRINDRMHPRMQKKGRVVDLSRLAAKKLDFIKNGLAKVKVEIVPEDTLE